ncbi:MAG: hypothetical protein HOW97_31615, partial [Catenulispora sp.]|nr:hypothetical protein [Catenulispora sp.]
YEQIRSALTMTFPDGSPVAEFMLNVHDDGTADWRWTDEPFDVDRQRARTLAGRAGPGLNRDRPHRALT